MFFVNGSFISCVNKDKYSMKFLSGRFSEIFYSFKYFVSWLDRACELPINDLSWYLWIINFFFPITSYICSGRRCCRFFNREIFAILRNSTFNAIKIIVSGFNGFDAVNVICRILWCADFYFILCNGIIGIVKWFISSGFYGF